MTSIQQRHWSLVSGAGCSWDREFFEDLEGVLDPASALLGIKLTASIAVGLAAWCLWFS